MSTDPDAAETKSTDDPVVLDERRGMAAQKATEVRRHLAEIEADQATLRRRQEKLEKFLVASPATTWVEAAEKARYLLSLFAQTSVGRDPRRQKIIAAVLDDFERLSAPPAATRPTPGNDSETVAERDKRLKAGDDDRTASRRATEGSRGKRRRGGGGLAPKGSPRPPG